jgi:hypothetical protein
MYPQRGGENSKNLRDAAFARAICGEIFCAGFPPLLYSWGMLHFNRVAVH